MFNKENFSNFVKKSPDFIKTKEIELIEDKNKEKIFDFQEEKEKLVQKMHKLLKIADEGGEISFGEKNIISVGFNGEEYKSFGKNGGEITKGDIAVASIWGKNLKLNPEVDRKTKKEFILRETRRKLQNLWDKQLTLGVKDSKEDDHINSIKGLEKSAEFDEIGEYEKMTRGHLAEKMVDSFFTKILTNNPDLLFTMEQGDVFDDAINKLDFIFHIKKEYTRGLNIDTCEDDCDKEEIGVQYTMNTNEEVQKKKLRQINTAKERVKKVDDIVLVTVPLKQIDSALKKWNERKKQKNNFSGPEADLSLEIQKELFTLMLKNLPSYLNINPEELWNKIKK